MDLSGKRLLVLGCTNNALDVHSFAVKYNVTIVLAGTYFGKEISEIADEKYIANIMDRSELEEVVKNHKIDGIFVGGNENIISCTIDVAEKLGLPFYATRKLWDCLMNKQLFKNACREHGVPTMADYTIDENSLTECADKLLYPVVIKPVDNCGAAGVMKCENKDTFEELYQYAKGHSRSGQVTVEEYCDGHEIIVYYTFVDGNVTLSSMGDKYVRGDITSFIPVAELYTYPSKYLPQYMEQIDKNMRAMLLSLGVRDGITCMQGFYTNGEFKFFEMGYRLGGTMQYRYTDAINGINSLHMMMAHALTGKMQGCDQNRDNAAFRKPCCTLSLHSKGGIISRKEGIDEARKLPEVLFIEDRYEIGDTIKDTVVETRPLSQIAVRVYIIADNVEKMKHTIDHLQDTIKLYDANGDEMLITHFDTDKVSFGENVFC